MDNFSQYKIMQKIEELREKQRLEEEKLLRQQEEQRKLLNVKQQKLYEVLGLQKNDFNKLQNHNGLQSYDTINCSASDTVDDRIENTPMKKTCDGAKQSFDETPAANPKANFLQLLQDKLGQLEDSNGNVPPKSAKPKQKFLKKGEGLARFRMKPDHVKQISHNLGKEKSAAENSKLRASWTALQHKRDYSPRKDSIDNSFLEKVQEAENKSKKELEELRVFELLEEQAQNSSFCSNSSILSRLMNESIKSIPIKAQEDSKNKQLLVEDKDNVLTGSCFQNDDIEMLYQYLNAHEQESIEPNKLKKGIHKNGANNDQQRLHVTFSDKNDYKSGSEEISCNSEESHFSDNSSRKLKLTDLRNGYHGDFQDNDIWSDDCSANEASDSGDSSTDTQMNMEATPTSSKAKVVDPGKYHSQDIISRAETCALCSEIIDRTVRKNMREVAVNTETDIQFQSSLLQTKLADLEKEIEIFRKENANLQKAQQQHQQEVAKFSRERRQLENKVKEQHEQLETALQEERKKLQRQKMVFDKYCKEARKGPSKQEREEIQALKQKIEELQDMIHKKDSKWSGLQARSREREKLLEKENRHLKEELELLKKAKATQKAKTTKHHQIKKTKILHSINDHIAKLTPDDLEDAIIIHDVVPKKISPTFLKKFSTDAYADVSEEVDRSDEPVQQANVKNVPYSYFLPQMAHKLPVGDTSRSDVADSCGTIDENKLVTKQASCSKSSESVAPETDDQSFEQTVSPKNNEKCAVIEKLTAEGCREKTYPDGRHEIWYANGNVKKISADGLTTKTIFYNGDVRERLSDGTVKYYFAKTKVWQTTNPDGSEHMEYSNGQVEFRMADGTMETTFPDLSVCTVYPDGRQKHVYKDGKILEKNPLLGTEITSYPNGQREICSKDHMRLEYPDGTVKILYPDGLQETRYSNGRIRIKDKDGKLIMDSLQSMTDSFNLQGSVT